MTGDLLMYKAIMFDWDGTLIGSLDMKVKNAGIVFGHVCGFPSQPVETIYRRHSGIPRRQLFEAISQSIASRGLGEDEFAQLSAKFTDLNRQSLTTVDLFDGVKETLEELYGAGIVTAISSSAAPDEIASAVKHYGLKVCLNEVLGSEGDFTKGKAHVDYICQKYGTKPADVIVVGDEPADVTLAKEAGASSVAKIGTYSRQEIDYLQPDFVIEAIPELLSLFRLQDGTRIHQDGGRGENERG